MFNKNKNTLMCESEPVTIHAARDGSKRPTFQMLAYSGAVMKVGGFPTPIIIDLAGIKARNQNIPILFNHHDDRIVGQTDSIVVNASGVFLTGTITGDSADAENIVSNAKNGFNWQASIGATVVADEFLQAGKKANVNGRDVEGPLRIVRKAQLVETSFCAIGADQEASASIAAQQEDTHMDTTPPVETETVTQNDIEAIREQEIARIRTINAALASCSRDMQAARVDELRAIAEEGIESGQSANSCELAILRASRTRTPMTMWNGGTGGLTRETIEASLLIRAGHENTAVRHYGERVATQARSLRAASLVDIAARCLQLDGKNIAGMSRSEIAASGFSTLSLPQAFANVMGKALLDSYTESTASWRGFASIKSAADFKPQNGVRPSFVGELEPLAPAGEIKHGTLDEQGIPWAVSTYAKMFTVDRTAVVNDDLGFVSETPVLFGKAAARAVNDLVWSTILGNAGSFFGTGHKNALSSDNVLSVASLGRAIALMRSQRDAQGNDIQIVPKILAVPPELESAARSVVNSTLLGSTDGAPTGNPLAGIVDVVVESRLSNTDKFANASATGWYVFAGPFDVSVVVGFLEGRQAPIIETFGFDHQVNKLALTYRCYHDFGCSLGDFRAAVYSAGDDDGE